MNKACADCGLKKIKENYKQGELVCTNCGLVAEKIIETRHEEKHFSKSQTYGEFKRTGLPLNNLKADLGLSSEISSLSQDAFGRKIPLKTKYRMKKLRWLNSISTKSETRNLKAALKELKTLAEQINLPEEIAATASIYYRKALKAKLIKGRSIVSMLTAALLLATRKHNHPLLINDIEKISGITKKQISRCTKVYITKLNIKIKRASIENLITQISGKLKLTIITQKESFRILEEIKSKRLTTGKSPSSIVAVIIYLACLRTGERRTQTMISEATFITPLTLRNRFREISSALTIDVKIGKGVASTPVYFRNKYEMDED